MRRKFRLFSSINGNAAPGGEDSEVNFRWDLIVFEWRGCKNRKCKSNFRTDLRKLQDYSTPVVIAFFFCSSYSTRCGKHTTCPLTGTPFFAMMSTDVFRCRQMSFQQLSPTRRFSHFTARMIQDRGNRTFDCTRRAASINEGSIHSVEKWRETLFLQTHGNFTATSFSRKFVLFSSVGKKGNYYAFFWKLIGNENEINRKVYSYLRRKWALCNSRVDENKASE